MAQESDDDEELTPFEIEFERDQQEAMERFRQGMKEDGEALKREIWFCKVGDFLEVIARMELFPPSDDDPDGPQIIEPAGQLYRAVALKGRGWDFVRVSGHAPKELRIMNWEIPGNFRVVEPPPAAPDHGKA